ncbi:down syndrome cell adhesion molecule 4-like protein, partial [Sarcoptes scabiei]
QSPSIVERFDEIITQPGDSVSLRCVSQAAPLAQIEWTLDGSPIPSSTRYRFGDFVIKNYHQKSDQTLLISHLNITNARIEDGGLYRCTARNLAGSVFHQARVNVVGKGSIKLLTPNITAVAGTDLQLNCPYYGYPIKSISWFGKDGLKRKLPINDRQTISSNGTLHIR